MLTHLINLNFCNHCACYLMDYKPSKFFFLALFSLLLLSPTLVSPQLDYNYYDATCPKLARIVRYGVRTAITNDTRMSASLLRLHFHDCFVNVFQLISLALYLLSLPAYNRTFSWEKIATTTSQ